MPAAADSAPRITLEQTPPSSLAQYSKYEAGFGLNCSDDKPFDPLMIDVQAVFVSPSGKQVRVPGFYFQDYPEENVLHDTNAPETAGPACWKIRFTPAEAGLYRREEDDAARSFWLGGRPDDFHGGIPARGSESR